MHDEHQHLSNEDSPSAKENDKQILITVPQQQNAEGWQRGELRKKRRARRRSP